MTKALELAKFGRELAPTGAVVGDSDTQTLSAKTFSDMPVFSGGTANAVPYLSATKVLTTGTALTFNGTTLVCTGAITAAGLNNSGNFAFTGTAKRITGDFSNATLANRVAFQTSTVNGTTTINAIPNGTATTSQFVAHAGTDMDNASRAGFNTSNTQAIFFADKSGTGTYLPLTFYIGGSERVHFDTSGNVGIGVTPGAKFHVEGAVTLLRNPLATGYTSLRLYNDVGSAYRALEIDYNGSTYSGGEMAWIGTTGAYPVVFGTNNTERVRITDAGHLLPAINDTYDLGGTGKAWRNIYTNDLHLNNESKSGGNDIDGTTGNWTIQEGADNLYIINNKTGKKYSFALKEVV